MAEKRQDELAEQSTIVDMDDLWMNTQIAQTGDQKQIHGVNIPFQPRSNRASWVFDSSTSDSDPGAAGVRFNNVTQNLTSFIYISYLV